MKAKLSSHYRKNGGLIVFVYVVLATLAELVKYKEAQGANYRENEQGEPLFFSSRALSTNPNEQVPLIITQNSRVVANDTNKVLFQQARLEEYILQEQAKLMAAQAVGRGGVDRLADLTSNHSVATEADVTDITAAATVGEPLTV
jgi:hypothetical protein